MCPIHSHTVLNKSFNIVRPSLSRYSKWSLPFVVLCLYCVCYTPHCFLPSWFDDPNNARCCVEAAHYVAFSIPFCCRPVPCSCTPPVYHDYVLLECDTLFGRCQGEAAAASIVSVSRFYPEYEDHSPPPPPPEELAHELHNVLSQRRP